MCEQQKSKSKKTICKWINPYALLTNGQIGSLKEVQSFKSFGERILESALSILLFLWVCFGLYTLMSVSSGSAEANAVIPELAIKAIVGEAAGEPYIGKVALAEAIRNRGHLNGVFGLKRESFISEQPKWVHDQAKKAWNASAKTNHVKGASFWESTDFPEPYWAKGMKVTAHIGKHKFYRKVKNEKNKTF